MPISGRFSYVCLRYTLPIDYLGVGFYGSLVFSASIVPGLNTKVDRAFVPRALFRSGPPSLFAWVGFETRCIFEMGCETRGGRVSALGGVIFQSLPGGGSWNDAWTQVGIFTSQLGSIPPTRKGPNRRSRSTIGQTPLFPRKTWNDVHVRARRRSIGSKGVVGSEGTKA